ncbi:hypothetical protein KOI35_43445 [Actinoplanes bogorensis]|uniref:Uncharacterized protein n=1 Tax=Paractinoplanes bogorensis TaxID=1610840 RepID=A0ABS5Z3V9_9ACTN|nr:hypothetical protein [Actinoplanes bogorensis]MBU2670379.1 hypothetical protein [Actinoplanes bogorensis]
MPTSTRDLALAVVFATRVTSGIDIFLGRLDRPYVTDTFDPGQGVELKWRELDGMTQPDDLARALRSELPLTRQRIQASNRPGASVAATAIDVIAVLLDDSLDDRQRVAAVAGSALRVALEMDRTAVRPPIGRRTWSAFELHGQADLADLVDDATEGFLLSSSTNCARRPGRSRWCTAGR